MLISKIRNDINGSDDENGNDGCSDDSWDDDGHIFEDSSKTLPSSIPNEDRSIPGIPFNPFTVPSEDTSSCEKDSEEAPEKDIDDIEENEDEMNALVDLLEDFGNQQMKAEAEQFHEDKPEAQFEADPKAESHAELENRPDDQLFEKNKLSENVFESEDPEDDQHQGELEEKFKKPVPPPRPSFKN